MRRGYDWLKRLVDVLATAVALVLLSPVMLVTAAIVRVRLGSPVLFRQMRPGLNGILFKMLKFRTMIDAFDSAGRPLPDADRLTSVGRALRAASLDELPELINVLKGDMSLVGPRPLLTEYLSLYSPEQARRHEVRPGITGWAQVNGRNALNWSDRLRLDVWYVDNRSLLLDLRILIRTVASVFRARGIAQPGHATAEKFRGNPP